MIASRTCDVATNQCPYPHGIVMGQQQNIHLIIRADLISVFQTMDRVH